MFAPENRNWLIAALIIYLIGSMVALLESPEAWVLLTLGFVIVIVLAMRILPPH